MPFNIRALSLEILADYVKIVSGGILKKPSFLFNGKIFKIKKLVIQLSIFSFLKLSKIVVFQIFSSLSERV